jgi:hypothetical protein
MTAAPKDKAVVYVDVDDEITSVIDKMQTADGRIVALVLPKRASVLQSIVNMKLLKRSAETNKKRLVLITTEAGLLPLAGAAGLHVASTLQSAPAIPAAPGYDDAEDSVSDSALSLNDEAMPLDLSEAAETPIGELAGATAAAANEPETIELDNEDAAAPAAVVIDKKKKPKVKKDSKLKVPNFSRFRVLIVLGVIALIAISVFLYLATEVLPKASITISTDSSDIKTTAAVTLDPKATTINADGTILPASMQQKQQSTPQQVPATGSQNNGQPAHGNVTISNCTKDNSDVEIPQGTGISTNGMTYITQGPVSLDKTGYRSKTNTCSGSAATVAIVAQKPGTAYNVSDGTKFTLAAPSDGSYSVSEVPVVADGGISGGTDTIVKVVAQADIDSAKQKLSTQDTTSIKQGLQQALEQGGYNALATTFNGGTPEVTQSANVGDKSDTVTVTQVTTYTMYGVKKSDLKQLIVSSVNKKIDDNKQAILDDGSSNASFKVTNTSPEQVTIEATSTTGPHIVVADLKKQIAGKKSAAISSLIKTTPGVADVKVHFSPFWVDSAPSKPNKITVTFQKSR